MRTIAASALVVAGLATSQATALPLPNDFFGTSSIGQLGNDKEAEELLRLGGHNVRNNFEWNKVQPADCNGAATAGLNWSYYDQRVRRAAEHNLTIIADLFGTRLPQACPTNPRQFPVRGGPMYNDWYIQGGYIWQLVQRYGVNGYFWNENPALPPHPIRIWEVWNEENQAANNWGGTNIQPQAYAQLLVDTSKTIRKAQETQTGQSVVTTGTKVLMGGIDTFVNDMAVANYLTTIYSSPSGYTGTEFHNAFDGLSFHPYALTGNAAQSESYVTAARSALDQKRSALAGGSDAEKTLWITELGWPVGGFTNPVANISESTQALYLEEALPWIYSNATANKIEYASWYAYADSLGEIGETSLARS